jgi:hypothetical protein
MYTTLLFIHSWIRWITLVAVVGTILAAIRRQNVSADKWGLAAMATLDLQLLIGLILYLAVSPNMREILANFGGAMKDPTSRFWAVEHITAMFAAVIAAHVGRVLARKAVMPESRRKRLLTWFSIALVLILIGMPWPGRPGGRDLFRLRL